jgi:hypothetical protein
MQSLMRSRLLDFQLALRRNTSYKKSKTLLGKSVNWSETAAGLSKPHAGPLDQRCHHLSTTFNLDPPKTSHQLINSNLWLTPILINSPPLKSQSSNTSMMINKIERLILIDLVGRGQKAVLDLTKSTFRPSTLEEAAACQARAVFITQEIIRPKAMNMGTTHTQLSAM